MAMEARELLNSWPEWSKAGAEKVLSSPAWHLITRYGEEKAELKRLTELPKMPIALEVGFDGEIHHLEFAVSSLFPDLALLSEHFEALPREVLLALVEKECGTFFQLLENVFRKQLTVNGLAAATSGKATMAFSMKTESGGEIDFALDMNASLELELGLTANLDVEHEWTRTLERPARVEYGTLALSAEELDTLSLDDFLVVGEDFGSDAVWVYEERNDERIRIVHPETGKLTFGAIADGKLPPIPESGAFLLMKNGETLAKAEKASVGAAAALKITALYPLKKNFDK